jgi:hypothetical protein
VSHHNYMTSKGNQHFFKEIGENWPHSRGGILLKGILHPWMTYAFLVLSFFYHPLNCRRVSTLRVGRKDKSKFSSLPRSDKNLRSSHNQYSLKN